MKILLLTQWFDPEPTFKGLAFASELVRQGFDVEVVTGFPNYPGGKLYSGYKIRFLQREVIDGVSITRVPLYPSHNGSSFKRILNYVSFGFSSMFYCLFMAKRPDVIYAYHPPLTTGLSAFLVRFFRRIPIVYDIQDMWPDSLAATGMLNNPRALKLINLFCRMIYRSSDKITVLSPGFKHLLIERGVSAEKIEVIYNWCDETAIMCTADAPGFPMPLNTSFTVMFAGNIGHAQRLGAVIEAAEQLAILRADISFVFVGSGVASEQIEKSTADKGLKNVYFIPQVPMKEIGSYLNGADVLMVHLKDDPLFSVTIPSKTQAYMAIGKPILMAVRGDAADLIQAAECGVTAIPENAESIAQAILQLADMSVVERQKLAENARHYYFEKLSLKQGVTAFSKQFLALSKADRL